LAAYVVLIREGEITDHEALRRYRDVPDIDAAKPSGMEPLAYYGSIEALEGAAPDGAVIFRFPDVEAARDWYFSPQYQARVGDRQKAAPYRCFIVEGLAGGSPD
jgi:uncharacterized protein (DUF1330 family)